MLGWSGWHGPEGAPGASVPIHHLGCPTAVKDALAEGCSIGSLSPAAGTFTALASSSLTTAGPASITGATTGGNSLTNLDLNGAINPLGHGVICDGVTDNTTNFQAAINAARQISSTGVGEVDIPGSCNTAANQALYIASGVTIPDNVIVKGLGGSCYVGAPCVEILCGATSGACVTSTSTHGAGLINVALKTTASGSSGLKLDGTFHFNVKGDAISGFANNGLWLTETASSAIYNYIRDSNISNNGLDLFLDGTASSSKAVGGNSFTDDQFTSSSGTYNIVGTSFSTAAGAAGYQNVYQNDFQSIDISLGNGSATVGIQSNATLNWTFENVTGESLLTQFQLNPGTVNFDVRGTEGAILGTSTTGVFTATGDDTYSICMGYLAGVGASKCWSTMPRIDQYDQPTALEDSTGQIGMGQRVNLLTFSQDFTNAVWTSSGITSVTNSATSPSGIASSASAAVLTSGGAAFFQQSFTFGSSIANTCWTGSVWMKTASGTARPQLILFDSAGTQLADGGLSSALITTSWNRYYVTGCASGGDTNTGIRFRPMYFSANAPVATVDIWGAQLSVTNGPMRYVPTVASTINDVAFGISTPALSTPPVTVSNLPATCQPGDIRTVQDWNGTNGTCTGGGADYTPVTCGASNVWYCP